MEIIKSYILSWSFCIDFAILVIIITGYTFGRDNGGFRGFAFAVSGFVSLLLAKVSSIYISAWIFKSFVRDSLYEAVKKCLETHPIVAGTTDYLNEVLLPELPNYVQLSIKGNKTGVELSSMIGTQSPDKATEAIVNCFEPAIIIFLKSISVIVLFVIFFITIRIAIRFIFATQKTVERVFHASILSGLEGVVLFGTITLLACKAIYWLNAFGILVLDDKIVEGTYLFKHFYYF